MLNILNNIDDMRRIARDMAEGMSILAENYNSIMTIEEKMINIKKDINDVRTRSYMAKNLFKRSLQIFESMIMRIEDASSVSLDTKNILKVALDMSSHMGKRQGTTKANDIRKEDISLSKDKNISKGIQKMPIIPKDKSLVNNSPS